ncbi:tRNA(Ile)-lysidine synthase [Alicyclobacillus acidoterrestris]|nr:tRNA(Ile)-lysidine synthase [Alicyclobacillus acidoterrestris]
MQVREIVRRFLQQHVDAQNTLILGVSGGLDSMAMLHVMQALSGERPPLFRSLLVVHVHHGLRELADHDAAFVRSYCQAHGIACKEVRVTIDAQSKMGIEAAARTARYAALTEVARAYPHPVIALAHHQGDQVETVLLRWLRGAGLHGLSGMRAVSQRAGVCLIRPLLALSKEALAAYAREHGVPHVEDETNADDRFTRNFLRRHVVPQLARLQPEIGAVTARLTETLQDDDDYLRAQAQKLRELVVDEPATGLFRIRRKALIAAHVSLQRRLIQILLNCFALTGWSSRHIEAVRHLAETDGGESSVQLPHGVEAWRSYENLYIGHAKPRMRQDETPMVVWNPAQMHRLTVDGTTVRWRFFAVRMRRRDVLRHHFTGLWRIYVPVGVQLEIRLGVSTAVRVRPLGLNGSKKLQDIYTDKKIPRTFRSQWPIVSVDGRVVWLPGLVRTEAETVEGTDDGDVFVIVAHMNRAARDEIGTFSRETRRMISE